MLRKGFLLSKNFNLGHFAAIKSRKVGNLSQYYFCMEKEKKTGFVIDIDGTLVLGQTPIPGAKQTLEHLHSNNHPLLLLTNNCAPSQHHKAQQITKLLQLDFELKQEQIVLNYTPIKHRFKDMDKGVVLVVGRDERLSDILPLPELKRYITVTEYCSLFPEAVPLASEYNQHKKQETYLKLAQRLQIKTIDKFTLKITGILLLMTPTHWQQSIQIILDVLSTPEGVPTTHHSYQHQENHIPVMACYNDMFSVVKNHPLPRLLMKPYTESLKTVYELIYKNALKIDIYGKPHPSSYNFAKKQLQQIYGSVDRMVMVGDNIQADIIGPSELGWDTILVKSGVSKQNSHIATINAEHIQEGISMYFETMKKKQQ